MGKTRLIASQNTPEAVFSMVYRFILARRHFGVISWIHMIQKNQGEMPSLTSFFEPFSCSDLSCLCWSLLTSIQPRSMSDTVWWSKNKKRSSLLCTQTQSRFSSGTCGRNRTLELFYVNSAGQLLITQKYAQMHMLANPVYLSLIFFSSL